MHGIDTSICMHNIYIQYGMKHVCQPQRRMNPLLKDIVKYELVSSCRDGQTVVCS
jgi:hypothetical protein